MIFSDFFFHFCKILFLQDILRERMDEKECAGNARDFVDVFIQEMEKRKEDKDNIFTGT